MRKLDEFVGEASGLAPRDANRADGDAFPHHRDYKEATIASRASRPFCGRRHVRLVLYIVAERDLAAQGGSSVDPVRGKREGKRRAEFLSAGLAAG